MNTRKTRKSRKKIGRSRRLGKRKRGSGKHGGKGRAGHGKRAGHKKSSYALEIMEKGFKSRKSAPVIGVNLTWIQKNLEKIQKNNVVDVTEYGFGKVIGGGFLKAPVKIKAKQFSKKALDKIKKAGGEAIQC